MVATGDLIQSARRLKRLKAMKARLASSDINGVAHWHCYCMCLGGSTLWPFLTTPAEPCLHQAGWQVHAYACLQTPV